MTKAFENQEKNHFLDKTFQPGYSETWLYDNDQVFQIAQASYNVGHTFSEKNTAKQEVFVNKIRAVIDSALTKSINNELNFKKFDSTFGPENFISIGQNINFEQSSKNSKKKKFYAEYKLIDEIDYQGEVAYHIESIIFRKGKPFIKSKILVEKESFAFLYRDVETIAKADLNRLIPRALHVIIRLFGFHYNIQSAKVVTYYKRNQKDSSIFDIEKGFSTIEIDVKRTERWIKGKISQEFYLLPRQKMVDELPSSNKVETQFVEDFNDNDFFIGLYHLPIRPSTKKAIEKIQAKNKSFTGSIASDRYEKWNKKYEKRKSKREK